LDHRSAWCGPAHPRCERAISSRQWAGVGQKSLALHKFTKFRRHITDVRFILSCRHSEGDRTAHRPQRIELIRLQRGIVADQFSVHSSRESHQCTHSLNLHSLSLTRSFQRMAHVKRTRRPVFTQSVSGAPNQYPTLSTPCPTVTVCVPSMRCLHT